jgi:hypothetical protein
MLQAELEHVDGPLDVRVQVHDGIAERADQRDLAGDVEDSIEPLVEHGLELRDPADVASCVTRAGRDVRADAGRFVVDDEDIVAAPDEPIRQMRTDEAGASGHEDPHRSPDRLARVRGRCPNWTR